MYNDNSRLYLGIKYLGVYKEIYTYMFFIYTYNYWYIYWMMHVFKE